MGDGAVARKGNRRRLQLAEVALRLILHVYISDATTRTSTILVN
jgi:hypothetical protein